jgi:hypothetical protein
MGEPRPKTLTPEMAMRAGEAVVADLQRDGLLDSAEDQASAAADIARFGSLHRDGYGIAQDLDRYCGWGCDLEVANVLDGFAGYVSAELEAAEKAWAEKERPEPPFPVGTKVTWRSHAGTIDGIYTHGVAKFTVAEDGDQLADAPTCRRHIVNFEDVQAA